MALKKIPKKRKIDFKYNLKVYAGFVFKYKALLFAIILLALVLQALSLVERFLFKVIIDNGTAFEAKNISNEAISTIFVGIAIVYLVASLIRVIGKWIHLHLINRFDANLIRDLKQRFFNHLIFLSHSFHTSHRTGSLIARLSRGAGAIERMSDFIIFNTLPLIFQLVLIGVTLAYFDLTSAGIVILTAIAFIGYSLLIIKLQKPANQKFNETEDVEKANISDIFTNIDSIKYYGKEDSIRGKFVRLSQNTRNAAIHHWDYFRWFDAGHNLILSLGTFFVMYFPLMSFIHGEMTLGTVVFIYTMYGNIFGSLYGFVQGIRGYYRSLADFDDLFQYAKIEQEVKNKEGAKSLSIKTGSIEFKEVTFKYHHRTIFSHFNLKIEPGEKVAIVGHSGSGKTTLIKLLYRFYDVNEGDILIDNISSRDVKQESLRSELSIVPQEGILFDDTIYNNILFSKPNATRAEVMQAMKLSQLDKIVKIFPLKESTIVGERGVKLSGGEKQRVSIARAILANKRIIVLDEATSALDSHTENEIQKDLEDLLKGRTSIIIAHRLSTIMKADKIVVLDKGKIVQIGTHNELIRQPGTYKSLWNLQKGGYLQE